MSRRFRVAMVAACPFPAARGTPVRILRMAEGLAARGHEVHVVTYHLGGPLPSPAFRVHRSPAIATYRKETPGPSLQKLVLVDPLLAVSLRRVLREHTIDLVHAHHYEGLLVARSVARGPRYPVLYDAHTLLETELGHYFPKPLRGMAEWFGSWLDVGVPRLADHVIAVAHSIERRLVSSGAAAADRVTVIGNGVESEVFGGSSGTTRADGVGERLIFTGNLAPYQGVDLMLQSFREIRGMRPSVRLASVTESSFAPYEALASELGIREAIDLLPAAFEDLPVQLAEARVALNPRIRCDGIPLKLLNYMSAARPIVSFEGSGQGLEHDRTALLVPDGDTAAFAGAVLRLLEQPELAERLGESARRFSRERHSWTRTAEGVERIYERMLGAASTT
jgi:glycosyltransferase involved in cell wall biosynthesis